MNSRSMEIKYIGVVSLLGRLCRKKKDADLVKMARKMEKDIVRERAEQKLMDRSYWIYERYFVRGKFLTRVESPKGIERNLTDEQIINLAR